MNLDLIPTIITVIASVALGFLVYFGGGRQFSNKVFFFLCLTIVFWALANHFSLHPILFNVLFWIRLVLFFAIMLHFAFLFFVLVFPQNKILTSRPKFLLLIILAVLAMAATLSPYVFSGTEVKNNEIVPISGPLLPLFILTILAFLTLGGYLIVKKYRRAKKLEKLQWKFILLGYLIMFFLLIISQFLFVVAFGNTNFVRFGPIFILPFIILSTYAIIKHNLLNVKVIAAELLVGSILLILFVKIFFSSGFYDLILNIIIFAAMATLSVFLIKAVLKEIQDRERIQQLAAKLEKANVELKKLDEAKSEFISIASHQLRTPLSAIKGYISMILEGVYGKMNSKKKEALNKVYQSNERLIVLVNDLLNISRIEEGRVKYNFERINLFKVVSGVIDELKPDIQEKKLAMRGLKEAGDVYVNADAEKIRQVVLNLIDNAIKYTQKGKIDVKLRKQKETILLTVSDTGLGMTKDEISGLFKKFSRGKSVLGSHTEGTGLGLYIAYKIVEVHKGKIWAKSMGRNKGSTFYVSLPVK